ncbi:MAG: ATP-binding cassette domain-containing protein [Clostridiales bacterium]|nr:ATP-binding cassette domain-containing protein [Clostridiales bacterium]MDY5529692.1 ATP-binding cassette domain-containing protein [Eubacteriales bacterium]
MKDIIFKNFSFSYPDKEIYKNFNTVFPGGKINVVLGASGVGKTTLLNALTGLSGFDGEIENMPKNVSYIFQSDRLVKTISVEKNLDFVLKNAIPDKTARKNAIYDMAKLLEISDVLKRLPTEISGGQAQRVQMARAFLYPSEVMLLDEPFKGLDVSLKTRLIKKFLELWGRDGRTVVLVTHDVYDALLMGDKVFVLSGSPADIVYETELTVEKAERNLTDAAVTKYRDEIVNKII